ncbi:2-polyprenyl-3-methyl-5-hydroxy-6-metoxy-1,4-benzoquinol methylase [Aquimarina sp. EL_43]|uniref:class I SAM-dependent methyltransferase n=1 Tax=unclassified Aquimarina TaxID=2627091 RepID=UPI0018CABB90|nr:MULTISPECIES: class I SAM-dependent methyltransferase [unclassified Aquimarina]MBG6128582.1 2-polyprenyl-3-methyl-5-hydroxy-6-metoxy-1,4-benzoquinol methylase [Aquimarina sp. EL_35]MBG6149645.1 2-polyprenyl-3-methyl-5-hydroxy-6-metoxy-1,4-benzoquinol methylase [Aquimarina sp. EL_32]MBG6167670.1 2-polyprenyl-3-methyl-5-hydroxy-6-metoxy-1,4-benzoquinol methylase [Aquimarina sp. EL_43]
MSKELHNYFETNKQTWNKKVDIHARSDFYDIEAFKRGKTSLKQYELEALGDVSGKSLLHLQCHFGQDTLSWSRLGAKCTGVDLSEKGIELAKSLNAELGLDAKFICCNVLDTSEYIKDKFDIVFTSYGVIGWLPDLKPWGKMIAERLKPGGVFYIVEFHPIVWMFDYLEEKPIMKYGYHQKDVIYEEYQGTYANPESNMISKEYGWNHGLGEVVSSLTEAGLTIEYLNEYDGSPYEVFPGLIKDKNKMFVRKEKLYPLVFAIKARR